MSEGRGRDGLAAEVEPGLQLVERQGVERGVGSVVPQQGSLLAGSPGLRASSALLRVEVGFEKRDRAADRQSAGSRRRASAGGGRVVVRELGGGAHRSTAAETREVDPPRAKAGAMGLDPRETGATLGGHEGRSCTQHAPKRATRIVVSCEVVGGIEPPSTDLQSVSDVTLGRDPDLLGHAQALSSNGVAALQQQTMLVSQAAAKCLEWSCHAPICAPSRQGVGP